MADSGNSLYYEFQIWLGHGGTPGVMVASGESVDAALGTNGQWQSNVTLQDGYDYEYKALPCYGGTKVCGKTWSEWYTFTVDLGHPNPPTLSPVNSDFAFFSTSQNPPPTQRTGNEGVPGQAIIGPNGSIDDFQYVYSPESSLSVTSGSPPACDTTTGDVVSVCELASDGTKQITVTPQEFTSTLSVVAIDAAGNASNGTTYTYYVNGTLNSQAQHGWIEPTGGSGSTVPDLPNASPSRTLTLGSGVGWLNDDNGPYFGHTYDGYLHFSGTTAGTAVTAAAPDVQADTSHSLTAAIWVNPAARLTGDTAYHTAFSQDGTADSGFYVQRTPDEHWRACMPEGQTNTAVVDCTAASFPVNVGTWTLLTLVWDAPAKRLLLYVGDGNTNVSLLRTVTAPSAAGPIVVGRALFHQATTDWWTGYLADPLLYNVALAPAQITALTSNLPAAMGYAA